MKIFLHCWTAFSVGSIVYFGLSDGIPERDSFLAKTRAVVVCFWMLFGIHFWLYYTFDKYLNKEDAPSPEPPKIVKKQKRSKR